MTVGKRIVSLFVAFCLAFSCFMVSELASQNVPDAEAKTTYKIRVSTTANVVTVYKLNRYGNYYAYKAMLCSTGVGNSTIKGHFTLKGKWRWLSMMHGVYGQYVSQISGNYLFHSVWYYTQNKSQQSTQEFNKLGSQASAGCVRLSVADAKWIYDNCPSGTPIFITSSSKLSKLGKPKAIRIPVGDGTDWDPTDPDPNNPYLKVKSISLTSKYTWVKAGKTLTVTPKVYTKYSYYYGKTGVKFSSSDTSIAKVNSNGVVTGKKPGKVTIKATLWKKGKKYTSSKTITVYKSITLNCNGGVYATSGTYKNKKSVTLKVANTSLKMRTLSRKGYTFEGWYTKASGGTKVTTYKSVFNLGKSTVYAHWKAIPYTISYKLDGGTQNVNQKTSYTVAAAYTLKTPTKRGYAFLGWYDASGKKVTSIAKGSTGNRSYTAQWSLKTYTIAFDSTGGTECEGMSYTVNDEAFTLPVPTKAGYTFRGWDKRSTEAVETIKSMNPASAYGNRDFVAVWEPITYTITFNLGVEGACLSDDQVTSFTVESEDIALLAPQEIPGYVFDGWLTKDEEGNFVPIETISAGTMGDIEVVASWLS